MHLLEELRDQDSNVVLLELWLFVDTQGQIQGPESVMQVFLPSHVQKTNKQQQTITPEVHVPTKDSQDWL